MKSDDGIFVALDLTIEETRMSLIFIYGPNNDCPSFIDEINLISKNFNNKHLIICGDFNLVLNTESDYDNYVNINNPNAR